MGYRSRFEILNICISSKTTASIASEGYNCPMQYAWCKLKKLWQSFWLHSKRFINGWYACMCSGYSQWNILSINTLQQTRMYSSFLDAVSRMSLYQSPTKKPVNSFPTRSLWILWLCWCRCVCACVYMFVYERWFVGVLITDYQFVALFM